VKRLRKWVRAAILVFATGSAGAHDLITAEAADQYLALSTRYVTTIRSTAPDSQRAEAAFQLGRMLDVIREYFNRDIAAHGQVVGLASNRWVLELKARGAPLAVYADGRFAPNSQHYLDALKLAPRGEREADCLFRLMQGYFYDSFDDDPLSPRRQSWAQLREQIGYGERMLQRAPDHPEGEEARFILAVYYVQAARGAAPKDQVRTFSQRAGSMLTAIEQRYPESMRAAAVPMLRERLQEVR